MAEERQCMCTTPEITIKLNKQGPQGKVGPQGEPGFSPYIGVANDTPSQYILRITNEDGEYLTPNLKANIPLGGNTGDVLTKNSDVNGDCSFKALPYATTTQQGVVYLATTEEALLGDPDYAITGEVLLGVLANKIGNGTITLTQGGVTKGTFTTNQAGNTSISLEDTTYTAGKNIVITGTSIATSNNPIFDRAISFTDRNGSEYEALSIEGLYPNTYIKVGMNNQGLQLSSSTSTITTRRSGNDYVNIDSGNIGSYATTYTTGDPLYIDTGNVIKLNYDSGKGLYVNGQSLAVRVDGTTIDFDNSGNLSYVGSAGPSYSAGTGIDITNNTISIDDTVVVTQSDISNMVKTNTTQTITGPKTFNSGSGLAVGYIKSLTGYGLLGRDAESDASWLGNWSYDTELRGTNINIKRNGSNGATYTNLDSGNIGDYALTSSNISTNAYIQALETKITALETNINGGNANA